jgi:NAD(P)-dependent dehydrogenase (short-subunit alcohol dehydrogenase family)
MSSSLKVAVITGAGSGIGKATALAFLKYGWSVAFAGRRQDTLDAALAGDDPTPIDALNVASELRELRVAIESLVRQVSAALESLPPSPPHP